MKFLLKLIFCVIFIGLSYEDDCESQTTYKVNITNDDDIKFQSKMLKHEHNLGLIIDRPVRRMNSNMIFRAPHCKDDLVEELLQLYNVNNYQSEPVVKHDKRRMLFDFTEADYDQFMVNLNDFDFNIIRERYLTSYEIDMYIDYVAKMIEKINPNIKVQVKIEGKSYEKRPIKSLTLQYGNKNNPIVYIDAGIHAREWHSRSMALYIMNQMIHEAESDTNGLIHTTTIIIVANINPDGYEYSLNVDHMWRKTRRPVDWNCSGVDGMRNFDAHWSMGKDENIPCKEVYKVLYPYGYTTQNHPNKILLHRIAMAGVNAVKRKTGSTFVADQSGSKLYIAAGGSDDYAIDIGIPFTYTFELGAEELGFAVPKTEIAKTVYEGWIAIKAMIIKARTLYNYDIY
ncbi:hypothetical protein PVAND_007038 [Polypedilum vanderplanki]|uniref:Peptidase M14 domain-containing protein n=1 Tax=Polypedilum vanderplanki TaxID=319348 RepID=A0A9J6C610_POLVA|nr:hypothetical protein PVAND_007038 [Polypedilum vanderplanki]